MLRVGVGPLAALRFLHPEYNAETQHDSAAADAFKVLRNDERFERELTIRPFPPEVGGSGSVHSFDPSRIAATWQRKWSPSARVDTRAARA